MTTTPTEEAPVVATAIQPEVVDLPADTHQADAPVPATVSHEQAATALIERAADAALMPGVPGRDEFITLAMTARMLCMSGAAPKEVRNNPYLAFHMAMVGRDLGISPSASLELIDVIPGSNGPRLSLSPQLLNGQVERLGLGHIIPAVRTTERAIALAVGPGGTVDYRCRATWPEHRTGCDCRGIIGESEFTWEDARLAGLVAADCQPGDHSPVCRNRDSKAWLRCNSGYVTYPKRMLWWRAAGFCADDWFPTASMGLYSPEALGAVVDDEGRPIDPSNVTLPDGYEPEKPEPPAIADAAVVENLSKRIHALPPGAQDALGAKWTEKNDQGYWFIEPITRLPERQVKKATALVEHFEDRARKGEWGDWTPPPAGTPAPPEPPAYGGTGGAAKDPAPSPSSGGAPAGDGAGDPPPPPVTEQPPGPPQDATPADPRPDPAQEHTGEMRAESEASEPCPVCGDTALLDGEPCWGCYHLLPACRFCGRDDTLRHRLDVDSSRCVDQDACWRREQAKDPAMAELAAHQQPPTVDAPVDVESREVPTTPAATADDPATEPEACPICHSKRSVLVFVPHGHGHEGGIWRCQAAGACRERVKGKAGVDVARAALGNEG